MGAGPEDGETSADEDEGCGHPVDLPSPLSPLSPRGACICWYFFRMQMHMHMHMQLANDAKQRDWAWIATPRNGFYP